MKSNMYRIKYLKFISNLLAIIPFVLLFVLIFISLFLSLNILLNKLIINIDETLNSSLISSICDLIIVTGLSSIPTARRVLNNSYTILENKIYNFINFMNISSWTKAKLINSFNNEKLIAYNSQAYSVKKFINNLICNKQSLFCITGESNTGKTSTVLLLFDQCANNNAYYKLLNKKTVYICKSYTEEQIKIFIKNYLLERYIDCYIFIDDIGELPLISQIKLWNDIILPQIRRETCNAKAITIITNNNNSLIKNKIINESINFLEISKDIIENKELSVDLHLICKKYKIEDQVIQNWLNSIYKNCKNKKIIDLLLCKETSNLQSLFICAIIVSKYSKIININLLKKTYVSIGYNGRLFSKNLKKLINVGVIINFPFLKNHLYINKEISQFFLLKYREKTIYNKIILFLGNKYFLGNDAEKWLIYCENIAISNNINLNLKSELFCKAFNTGNYRFLLDSLQKIVSLNKNSECFFTKELGYLHEKVGNRLEAITYLKIFINSTDNQYEKYEAYLLLFEIEHHHNNNTNKISEIAQSKNEFLNLQAKYWLEHINIEKGIFDYNKLFCIINQYSSLAKKDNINYYHILRRMYSDLAREYYLIGYINYSKFKIFKDKMNASTLCDHHMEYADFYKLLTKAHYIHYDIIFQIGFYNNLIHDCDDKYGQNPNLSDLLKIAIDEYDKCEKNFKAYGDKAWISIAIRKYELMLCTDIQSIKVISHLKDIKDIFISNDNKLHLAYIDCVLCKAEFLNYYLNHLDLDEKKTINKCRKLLEESRKIYDEFGNAYGIYRIKFLQTFIDFFVSISKQETLERFKKDIKILKNRKYNREFEMIEYILDMKNINTDLIRRFFMFYPIILQ